VKMLLLLALLISCTSAAWTILSTGTSCTGGESAFGVYAATPGGPACNAGSNGTCVCSTIAQNTYCVRTTCSTNFPIVPNHIVGYVTYSQPNCPPASATAVAGYSSGVCVGAAQGAVAVSYQASCASNGGINVAVYSQSATCSGASNAVTHNVGCVSNAAVSVSTTCAAGRVGAGTTLVNVVINFSATVTAAVATAIQSALASITGTLTVTISGAGSSTLTITISGTNAGLVGNALVGNVVINSNFFADNGATGAPSVRSATVSLASLLGVPVYLMLALLALFAFAF